MILAALQWRPQLAPLWCGLLVLLAGAWLWWTYRRLAIRWPAPRAALLVAPRAMMVLLLVLALFEPVWDVERRETRQGKIIVATDVSGSMDVADDGRESRRARAGRIVEQIRAGLPAEVELEVLEFDTQLRPAGAKREVADAGGVAGTDLGGVLVALSERSALGMVVLTDGGDEPIRAATLPATPLTVVGIGTHPSNWTDVAIAAVEAPATVEKDTQFEVVVDVVARGWSGQTEVELERAGQVEARQVVDLTHRRARVKFAVTLTETGLQRLRVRVLPVAGELSELNNQRVVSVDVQKKALHVLFFTRELGQDFKMLRSEIGRDPGIAFTALYRTWSERFTVQGDRLSGDEPLEAGFPTAPEVLRLFDCVMIGSFAASEWNAAQWAALTNYVAGGGAAVFLGGEKSFGSGGYAGTPVAVLLPWVIEAGEPELARGTFAVSIPAAAQGHPIVAGLESAVLTLSSVNPVGPVKPGAMPLLSLNVGGRNVAVAAVQAFGRGKVLGLASNTQWEWARRSEATRTAYGLFWRQAIRHLTGKTEGGRYLSVRWDKDHYQPGEQATAEIRVSGLVEPRLTATLQGQAVAVDARSGRANEFVALCRFRERGEYVFRLAAHQGETLMESYEKVWPVAPPLAEGSRLELDEEALRRIAEKTGGAYVPEREADQLARMLARKFWQRTITTETPLVTAGPQFALLVLALCVGEWWLRRRSNLI